MSDRVLAPFGRREALVTAREQHGDYVVLRARDETGPHPAAGQFYMLSAASRWGGGEAERPFLPRAFSVLRATELADAGATGMTGPGATDMTGPGTLELHFLIEDVGPGTNRLAELEPGDGLRIVGPLGLGFTPPAGNRAPLLVGGGVGIAPLAIWQDQLKQPARTLLGFRDAAHAPGAQLLGNAEIATNDGSVGHHGLVTELLRAELDADAHRQVYACGPPPMLEAVRALCAERDVPAQLALESGMACGYGACFGCVVPTRDGYVRLCVDGPVLEASQLETAQ
jgi:dihydroorotate dehydrogenase electron transfer subunit